MRTNRLIFGVVFWLFAAFLFAADADLRTWSSSGGGHSLKAEYLGKKGKDKAYLLKEDGRLVTVRLDALSEDDRAYIEEIENPDVDWTDEGEPDRAYYKKARKSLEERFDEIETWKDDEDFRDVGFDPSGPFFRWKLQVKKVQRNLSRQPMGKDKKSNVGALADAALRLLKLGDEYAETGGDVTARSRKEAEYIRGVFESLTDDPSEASGAAASVRDEEESDEPNPFEEETAAPPKKNKKSAGPKARKPKIDDEEEDDPAGRPEARRRRDKRSGGLIPLLGAFDEPENESEDAPDGEPVKVTYAQFKRVKMDMTKKEVFAILGKGTKMSVPFVGGIVDSVGEVYLWENDDDLGGCEVTFVDGKVEHKMWKGPGAEDAGDGSENE